MPYFYNPLTDRYELDSLSSLGVDQAVVTAFGVQLISSADAAAAIALLGIGASGVVSVNASSASLGALTVTGGGSGAVAFVFTVDATLVALAGLITAADQMIYSTGVNTFLMTNLTAFARSMLAESSAGNWRSQLGLSIGGNVQAWSADLDSFVTNATWAGSQLVLTGILSVLNAIQTGVSLTIAAPATSGATLLLATEDSNDVLRVLDTGSMTLKAKTGFAGNVLTITSVDLANLLRLQEDGDLLVLGAVTASGFAGDGGSLTGLDASQLTGGTVANARLDADLQALAANTGAGIWARTGSGTGSVRTMTGTAGTITVTNGDGVAANPTFTIASSYVGQATITTLGTITTGVWNGSTIPVANGGTGVTTSTGTGAGVHTLSATLITPAITAPNVDKTIIATGTTGNQTINKTAGSVNFALAATTLTVNNSLVIAPTSGVVGSVIVATVASIDATMTSVTVECTSNGSFVLTPDVAPSAECRVNWIVLN